MKYHVPSILCCLIALLTGLYSCKKSFLEKIPDKSLTVPTTLKELQQLLDNDLIITGNQGIGEVSSDDYYLPLNAWNLQPPEVRNAYLWQKDIFNGSSSNDWNSAYKQVYYANVVLEQLTNTVLLATDSGSFKTIRGSALLFRGNAFFNLLQLFAPPYQKDSASALLGIPLRLGSDPSLKVPRSSLADCYSQVMADLNTASGLLGTMDKATPGRPTSASALGLLGRCQLVMGDYQGALVSANKALEIQGELMDYNSFDSTALLTFPYPTNDEVYYQAYQVTYNLFTYPGSGSIVDSTLLSSYEPYDLRKTLFFTNINGGVFFKGSYASSYSLFCGPAVDEMFLIRAECNARLGNNQGSIDDLNTLRVKRWKTGTYHPLEVSPDALTIVLTERRKELCFRGLRWMDLRRLNKDITYQKTLTRIMDGKQYLLVPNDLRYTLPIPDDEIRLNGIQQNPR